MFKDLMSFAMVRTPVQALGFYIVYLLIGLLIGGVAGGIGGVMDAAPGASSFAVGAKWGALAGIPYVLIIGTIIVVKKKLGLGYYVLSLIGAILALLGGSILGLIPAAFITTRQVQLLSNSPHRAQ